jgi:alkylated DNA repair dioxygenase AlkB
MNTEQEQEVVVRKQRIFGDEEAWLEEITLNDSCMHLLEECVKEVKDELEERPPIKIFGKTMSQPRDVALFAPANTVYNYSNSKTKAKPVGQRLSELVKLVGKILGDENTFNGALVNRYNSGEDCIGDHSYNEKEIVHGVGVAACSWGAERTFVIKDKVTKKVVFSTKTSHRSMLIMRGEFQKKYLHGIPREKNVHMPRMSFTFRKHK